MTGGKGGPCAVRKLRIGDGSGGKTRAISHAARNAECADLQEISRMSHNGNVLEIQCGDFENAWFGAFWPAFR